MQGAALVSGQSQTSVETEGWTDWQQPYGGLGNTDGIKIEHEPALPNFSSESQLCRGLHQKMGSSRAREVIVPIYTALMRPNLQHCIRAWGLAQAAQRSCGFPIFRSIQGKVGWCFELPDLVREVSAMAGSWSRWFLKVLSNRNHSMIPW